MTYDQTNITSEPTGSMRSVSAFFDDIDDAQEAIEELRKAGIPETSVRLTEGASDGDADDEIADDSPSFLEMLSDFFFPEEDRHTYAEGLNRGGHLVTVTGLTDDQLDSVLDILDDEGAVDIDERAESWRSEGWVGGSMAESGAPSASGLGATSADTPPATPLAAGTATSAGASPDDTVKVVQERLRVGKRELIDGRVRVRSYVVEEPVSETVTLHEERVIIERRPVDRPLDGANDAFEERSIEAEEFREEPVVAKEARVIEEIGLKRTAREREETVQDTVRHTEVDIEDDRDTPKPDK